MEFRSSSDGSDQHPAGPLTPPPSSSTFPTGELSLIQRICLSNPLFVASAVDDYIRPVYRQEDILLDVECGVNRGWLYLSRLSQGSRGPCIYHRGHWLTPNEFQHISGRETAKDWKRSIRHCGKSMKLLLSKGILTTHCLACECDACRSVLTFSRFIKLWRSLPVARLTERLIVIGAR
jgi:SAND domain